MRLHIREHGDQHLDRQKMVSVSEMQSEFKNLEHSNRDSIITASDIVALVGNELGEKTTEYETLFLTESSDEIAEERDNLNQEKLNTTIKIRDLKHF